jgi:hypothetical protein
LTCSDVGIAAQTFLNETLDQDKLESGGVCTLNLRVRSLTRDQILQISVYVNFDEIPEVSFGRRSTVYPGTADFESLVEDELTFSSELTDLEVKRTIESPRQISGFEQDLTKPHERRSIESRAVHASGAGVARQSALSEYSADEPVHKGSHHWREGNEFGELRHGSDWKPLVSPPSQDKLLILGDLLGPTIR